MDYKTLSVKTFIEDMNGKEVMMKSGSEPDQVPPEALLQEDRW